MVRILNTCISKSWGGLEISALRFAENLSRRGHRVTTVVHSQSRLSEELRKLGLRQITVSCSTKYLDIMASMKIRRHIAREAIEVVQAHHSRDLWILYPALVGMQRPKLFYFSRILFRGTTKRDVLHRLIYSKLTGVITLTQIARRYFIQNTCVPAEKVTVIPDGFDPRVYKPSETYRDEVRGELGIEPDEIAVGCTSRIDPQKGQYELVEAARMLRGRIEKLKVIIVGEPTYGEAQSYFQLLKRKVDEYGMQQGAIFTGYRDDIPRVLSGLDIFVLPSYEETFGNSVVEAMMTGLACIGTDAGGVPELLDGGSVGLLVQPRSVRDLAKAIELLAQNPQLREDLGARARVSAIQRFSLDKMLDAIQEFYAWGLSN